MLTIVSAKSTIFPEFTNNLLPYANYRQAYINFLKVSFKYLYFGGADHK